MLHVYDEFVLINRCTFLNGDSIGFKNVCTLEDIQRAYPFLDMVDHDNRKRVVGNITSNLNFT